MNIMLVHPGHLFSTTTWFFGIDKGLKKLGHDVVHYPLHAILDFYGRLSTGNIWEDGPSLDMTQICYMANMPLVMDAIQHKFDWIIVINGEHMHAAIIEILNEIKSVTGTQLCFILTESPYKDEHFGHLLDVDLVTTNERTSALTNNWEYLPPGVDVDLYRPGDDGYKSEVFFAGSAYDERVALFRNLGIDAKIIGNFPDDIATISSLFLQSEADELAKHVRGAKIGLNLHRYPNSSLTSAPKVQPESTNPRTYELAASKTFMLVDNSRPEVHELFGDTVDYFEANVELESKIRYYLNHEKEREEKARAAYEIAVKNHSWVKRAEKLVGLMS